MSAIEHDELTCLLPAALARIILVGSGAGHLAHQLRLLVNTHIECCESDPACVVYSASAKAVPRIISQAQRAKVPVASVGFTASDPVAFLSQQPPQPAPSPLPSAPHSGVGDSDSGQPTTVPAATPATFNHRVDLALASPLFLSSLPLVADREAVITEMVRTAVVAVVVESLVPVRPPLPSAAERSFTPAGQAAAKVPASLARVSQRPIHAAVQVTRRTEKTHTPEFSSLFQSCVTPVCFCVRVCFCCSHHTHSRTLSLCAGCTGRCSAGRRGSSGRRSRPGERFASARGRAAPVSR